MEQQQQPPTKPQTPTPPHKKGLLSYFRKRASKADSSPGRSRSSSPKVDRKRTSSERLSDTPTDRHADSVSFCGSLHSGGDEEEGTSGGESLLEAQVRKESCSVVSFLNNVYTCVATFNLLLRHLVMFSRKLCYLSLNAERDHVLPYSTTYLNSILNLNSTIYLYCISNLSSAIYLYSILNLKSTILQVYEDLLLHENNFM